MALEDQEAVLIAVREAIGKNPRFRDVFEPLAEGMRNERDWWFVPVTLSNVEPVQRRMSLYAQFAELESYIQTVEGLNVLLIPVITEKTA
jgi:hypothetical protein